KLFPRRTDRRKVAARSRSPLEKHAFGLRQIEDRAHRVFDRVDEARGALRSDFDAAVKPNGRVEGHHLVQQEMSQFVMKDRAVLGAREVTGLPAPTCNSRGDAAYQLANAGFALGSPSLAVKIFRSNDVRGRHRPTLRHFDILLLENDLARFADDGGGPVLPLDSVVRRNAFTSEVPPALQPLLSLGQVSVSISSASQDFLFHACPLLYCAHFEYLRNISWERDRGGPIVGAFASPR